MSEGGFALQASVLALPEPGLLLGRACGRLPLDVKHGPWCCAVLYVICAGAIA